MIKTYKALNSANLFTSVMMDGKVVNISFDGGFTDAAGRVTNGTFSTADKELQGVIEKDSSYGKSFISITASKKGNNDNQESDDVTLEQIDEVTNAQMAIEWLDTNKDVKFDGRPSADVVRAKAAELGVVFSQWPVK